MSIFERHHGIVIELPDDMTASDRDRADEIMASLRGRLLPSGPVPMPGAAEPVGDDLALAMTEQGMDLLDSFELRRSAPDTGRRGGGAGRVSIDLAGHEDAVLLLEQDGVYAWRHADGAATVHEPARRRGPLVTPARKRLVFELAPPGGTGAGPRRGLIDEIGGSVLRAWVLRFAARHALATAIRVLERNVRHRLVHLAGTRLEDWCSLEKPADLRLPTDRAARILLLVHGTFSSTAGSFHALTATSWGRTFLTAAIGQYDCVLGFDHPTLGHDPAENAGELLAALEHVAGTAAHSIDMIGFSRGCMVARSLAELLLPAIEDGPRVRRLILVGATNAGTRLAEPKNWECLADLYTNLAVDACRLMQLFPAAAPAATILKESLASLGALVKYTAVAALEERLAPGLAALAPGGEFAARLNREQSGPGFESFYYLVSSEFDAALAGRDDGLPRRLLSWVLDLAADKFMNCANDLVVDLGSMELAAPRPGVFVQGKLTFGANPNIHHTAYFLRPELTRAMGRWLDAGSVQADAGAAPDDWLACAVVEKKIRVLPAGAPLSALRDRAGETPDYLVIERRAGDTVDYYVRPLAAVRQAVERTGARDDDPSLEEVLADTALALRAGHPSPAIRAGDAVPSPSAPRDMFVLLKGDLPLAVAWPPGMAPLSRLRQLMPSDELRHRGTEPRRRMRGGGGGTRGRTWETPEPAEDRQHRDHYYFGASMKETIAAGRTETVRVLISRDRLEQQSGIASSMSDARLPASRPGADEPMLIIQLIPKTNLEIVGEDRYTLAPESVTGEVELMFDIRATASGDGELWVLVRHGALRLATLTLKTRIASGTAAQTSRSSAAASSTMDEAADASLPVLQIFERRNGDRDSFLFALDLGDGHYVTADSAPLRADRQEYVSGLYAEIEERWLGSQHDYEAFNQELRAFGGSLFDQLVPVPI